jgi:hypothetical protein
MSNFLRNFVAAPNLGMVVKLVERRFLPPQEVPQTRILLANDNIKFLG